jgi:glycosyltransferase involved in cell wall biosynthesis
MNIFTIIKCSLKDSFDFITQVAKINQVKRVTVFRDDLSLPHDKVHYVLPFLKKSSSLKNLFRLFQIIIRRKLKPSIIIGIYEIPHGLLAVIASRLLNVPSAVSIIGNPAYSKLRKGFRMKLTMWILKNTSFITVTGINSKQFLISKGLPDEKIFILPNTLDFSTFKKQNNPEKKYDIISLGRISNEKHVEIIVQIIAKLKKEMPALKAAIAGSGPELEGIKALVKLLELEKTIDIPGYIPEDQLENFYNSGRVFALTSETEGFPRTIIQAAACGVPVVASRVGDIDDIIENDVNGFLVERFDDVNSFTELILKLLNDHKLYNQFSEDLMKKVHESFSHHRATEVWASIIQKTQNK